MSELTLCNHCSLLQIKRWAKEEGATVKVTWAREPEMRGWQAVIRSDKDEPVAYFHTLTTHCVC